MTCITTRHPCTVTVINTRLPQSTPQACVRRWRVMSGWWRCAGPHWAATAWALGAAAWHQTPPTWQTQVRRCGTNVVWGCFSLLRSMQLLRLCVSQASSMPNGAWDGEYVSHGSLKQRMLIG